MMFNSHKQNKEDTDMRDTQEAPEALQRSLTIREREGLIRDIAQAHLPGLYEPHMFKRSMTVDEAKVLACQ